jgi:hypothetical protein
VLSKQIADDPTSLPLLNVLDGQRSDFATPEAGAKHHGQHRNVPLALQSVLVRLAEQHLSLNPASKR